LKLTNAHSKNAKASLQLAIAYFINAKAIYKLSKASFINDIKSIRKDIQSFNFAIGYLLNYQDCLLNEEGSFKKEGIK